MNNPLFFFLLGGASLAVAQLVIGLILLGQLEGAVSEATLNFQETLSAVGAALDGALADLQQRLGGLALR